MEDSVGRDEGDEASLRRMVFPHCMRCIKHHTQSSLAEVLPRVNGLEGLIAQGDVAILRCKAK